MPEGEESALMSGQAVETEAEYWTGPASDVMTAEDLTDAVSASVSESVSASVAGMMENVSQRLDGLESGLQAVSERVQAVSDSAATREDLQAASASLSASLEEATLQAGEIGPVEEVGPVIISLIGDLLDALDTDGDGASDVASVVVEIRDGVQDIAGTLVHPAMSTPISDYSVLEALLLLLVFWQVVKLCCSMLRGGFGWLMR